MTNFLARARNSEFVRHNAIFFVGSVAIGALNYIYYPVLGRLLEPAPFGEVQTLVSLFLQLAIFLNVLGYLTVNIVANHGDQPNGRRTMLELEKLSLIISLIGLVAVVLLAPVLQRFFRFESFVPFIILAVAIVVSVPSTFRSAYLRGKKYFGLTSIAGLVAAAAKLAFSAVLILLGFGTVGAITGLVLAQLASFMYAAFKARQVGFDQSLWTNFFRLPDMRLILPELKYAGLVLVCSLTITAFYSIDIIAVKHYFDAHTAGEYAGIATVARIIFFLTASIAQVLLPSVMMRNAAGKNRDILLKSLVLTTLIGGSVLVAFWLLPGLITRLLMGDEYARFAYLLPRLSLVIFIVSLLNLLMLYFMALRRYAIAFIAIMGLAVTCGLIGINHDSLQAIVDSMLGGSVALATLLAAWMLLGISRDKREVEPNP
jgi:O-antigen/teichoic acid export membrane protein